MTKAEEAALKRFPEEMTRIPYQDLIEAFGGKEYVDFNSMPRGYFQLGYEQAEKDLALTWGDIQIIDHFILQLANEEREGKDWGDGEKFYTEVLNRFNKSKEGK